jgi:oligo-alginate lyase
VRESGGKVARVALIEASDLSYKDAHITAQPALTGKVAKMNRQLDGGGLIWIDAPLPKDGSLVGQYIHVANDNERDATYRIESAESDGKLTKLNCGSISFVRGYAGPTKEVRSRPLPSDYGKGFIYDFEEGAVFRIPLHKTWTP